MKPDDKTRFPVWRLMLVFTLLGASSVIYLVHGPKSIPKGDILGEKTTLKATPAPSKTGEDVQKELKDTINNLLKQSSTVVKDTADQSVTRAKETIINNTLETITTQIEKLPPQEQEKVKEFICK